VLRACARLQHGDLRRWRVLLLEAKTGSC
jgi:hypothetical protein